MKIGIKKAIGVIGSAIKAGASKIVKAIVAADTATLMKFGILIGVSVVTVTLVFKFLRDKKNFCNSDENKTVVDEAININYNDLDQQDKLHPLMKKVKKNLKKDLKPRKQISKKDKKVAKSKKVFDDAAKKAYINRVNKKYDDFLKEMDFDREYQDEIRELWSQEDNMSLRTIWDEP